MNILEKIFTSSASSLVGEVGNVVDKFHTSTDEKNQFKLELEKIISARDAALQDVIAREMEAKERVLVAELGQSDLYTKRARPSVVYFGLFAIFFNYCFVPFIKTISGSSDVSPLDLPEEFWWAWSGVVGTWVISRSMERTGNKNKLTKLVNG